MRSSLTEADSDTLCKVELVFHLLEVTGTSHVHSVSLLPLHFSCYEFALRFVPEIDMTTAVCIGAVVERGNHTSPSCVSLKQS